MPHAGLFVGLLVSLPLRIAVWSAALLWMALACILNARRCGRTHCRYTGPYYLLMIVPVLVLGLVMRSDDVLAWLVVGAAIVAGDKFIWWVTERAWGKFS